MALRRLFASMAAAVLLSAGVLTTAPSNAAPVVTPTTGCSDALVAGDFRLGPDQLPTSGEIGQLLQGYNRLGGLTADQWIATFWDPTAQGGKGGFRFPPDNGYLLTPGPTSHPIEYVLTLGAGQNLDRFGGEGGAFLAPEGTPYSQRALPPASLDNRDPAFPCNYHEYRVTKSFRVDSGPIAPGFDEPGMGRQYQLDSSLVPGAPTPLTVLWLVQNGFLARIP